MTLVYLGLTVLQCFAEWHMGEDAPFSQLFSVKDGKLWPVYETKDLQMWVAFAHVLYTAFTLFRAFYVFQNSLMSILNTYIIPEQPFVIEYRGTALYVLNSIFGTL